MDADATVWVLDPDSEVWHASMFRDADRHSCACGARLEAPIGGIAPDDARVGRLDRCRGCLRYLDRTPEPADAEFSRASELRADGGQCVDVMVRSDCCVCDDGGTVRPIPEAGYATCVDCGERGYWRDDGTEWWRNDPESQWYTEPATEKKPAAERGLEP